MAKPGRTKELVIPPGLEGDADAAEVLRAWLAHGDLHCSLKPTIWPDPGTWGMLLADVARHVADALQQKGKERQETLDSIRDAFDEAMDAQDVESEGGFQTEE
jgi:hypothetical protein